MSTTTKLKWSAMSETIIKIQLPLKRVPKLRNPRWFHSLFTWGGGSVQEFGGRRVNQTRHLCILGRHVLTIHRNEYHDRSDAERADEYLREWSKCEKELKMFRIAAIGEGMEADVKKLIKDSMGVDFDEGTIQP